MERMVEGALLGWSERRRMMARLRKAFSWVGASIPRRVVVDGEPIPLRRRVAELLAEPQPTDQQRVVARRLLALVERKVKADESRLERDQALTQEDALALFEEAVGLLRAVVDLREVVEGRKSGAMSRRVEEGRVEDARRWQEFLKQVKR